MFKLIEYLSPQKKSVIPQANLQSSDFMNVSDPTQRSNSIDVKVKRHTIKKYQHSESKQKF